MKKIRPSEITPEHVYVNRRGFMVGLAALAAGSVLSACARQPESPTPLPTNTVASTKEPATAPSEPAVVESTPVPTGPDDTGITDELGDQLTPYESVVGYNNFYEFTLSKTGVAQLAESFVASPWQVEVGGHVRNPRTFDMDDLLKLEHEERIIRLRCVEAWSMVIPWWGFPLSRLLSIVEPTSEATYVRFETLHDPERMPGQKSRGYTWPYVEGLRLDEAMHELTMLATGVYGKPLPSQNGAPLRLVLPWKYGFKWIKSIVRIDLVAEMPTSLWMTASPREYGFFANVNPEVSHPRWSQATERRIGEGGRRPTLMFNGYGEEVAHLYAGMDLRENY